VKLLLAHGAVMTADIDSMTPLHYTVSTGNEEIAQLYLDTPVKRRVWLATDQCAPNDDPHLPREVGRCPQGLTALHYAALTGRTRMTRFFLEHDADANAVSENGETPLHLAVRQDIHGQKWTPGNGDRWNNPDFRIEMTLDLTGSGSDSEEDTAEHWI
jgi:ankyrin repeat protein